jgi:inner membrane protein
VHLQTHAIWSIPYLLPFDPRELSWGGQWPLASWQNVVVTALLVFASWAVAVGRGRTLVEAFSPRADKVVVEIFRRRWPF